MDRSRKVIRIRRFDKKSKNPQQLSSRPLLPPLLEGKWSPDDVWRLTSLVGNNWSTSQFSDTPDWWIRAAPFFPGLALQSLRDMHVAIIQSQNEAALWTKDEVQTLIAAVYGNMQEKIEDTPEWWANIAWHLPGRSALDARLAYNTVFFSKDFETVKAAPPPPAPPPPPPLPTFPSNSPVPFTSWFGTSCQNRTNIMHFPNWTLDEYMFLMKVLTKNLNVEVNDAASMENITAQMEGKTSEEVRYLILKWRPQLLAALAKADGITAEEKKEAGPSGSDQKN